MSFLTNYFLGVRIWLWLYLLFSITALIGALIYFNRERIRKKYYDIRFPEKVIKCIIHYNSTIFKVFWRVIPDDKHFTFQDKIYNYDDKKVIKEHDFFVRKELNKQYVHIEGMKYNLIDKLQIKQKGRKYPEIHYWFNNPNPINYDFSNTKVSLSAKQMKDFRENDLFAKLLTLTDELNFLNIIMILSIVNIIASLFIISKIMGWIS